MKRKRSSSLAETRPAHPGFEFVVAHVATNVVRFGEVVPGIERFNVDPIDKESSSFSPESVHVVQVTERNHRVAVMELVPKTRAARKRGERVSCVVCGLLYGNRPEQNECWEGGPTGWRLAG